MKNYKNEKLEFISRVIWHNRIVANLMVLLEINIEKLPFKIPEWELTRRGIRHDLDKFEENFPDVTISLYVDGIKNNDIAEINKRTATLKHNHGESCPHHIEYHTKNNIPFSNLDICEICCDWIASSQKPRFKDQYSLQDMKKIKEDFLSIMIDKNPILENYRSDFISIFNLFENLNALSIITPYKKFEFTYEI